MRVLYIGSLQPTACATFYLHAMEQLGFQVTALDPGYFETESKLESLLLRVRKGPSAKRVNAVSQKIVETCKSRSFDAVFVMAENFLGSETIAEIKSLKKDGPLFLYHSHDNNFSDGILKPKQFIKNLNSYDFAFTTKSQNVEKYEHNGQRHAYFIPSAFDPKIHRPISDDKSHFKNGLLDLTFIGTYDRSRDKYLGSIGWENLHVWGNGWNRFANFKKYSDRIIPKAIYLDEYADIVSHSKISLGLLRDEADDLHTQRTFEIPACGSFQIAPRNSEILNFFEEDKEIVCFTEAEELSEKTRYYLKNDSERKKIAQAGYQRCLQGKHSYLDRVVSIFETAGSKSGRWKLSAINS